MRNLRDLFTHHPPDATYSSFPFHLRVFVYERLVLALVFSDSARGRIHEEAEAE